MKPICVPCERFMRPKRNGFYFVEGMPHSHPTDAWDGKQGKGSVGWTPYKVWVGDLWHCPDCGAQVVSDVAAHPTDEHYRDSFPTTLARTNAMQLFVKDC